MLIPTLSQATLQRSLSRPQVALAWLRLSLALEGKSPKSACSLGTSSQVFSENKGILTLFEADSE